jgi:UDP-N-acetylmuramate: L-alanyl-gamma-D-glutamyl-meso-diaminopimelate ligase
MPRDARLLVALEPRSNTMRLGVHAETLGGSLELADAVFLSLPEGLGWSLEGLAGELGARLHTSSEVGALVASVTGSAHPGDWVVVMSNGGFGGIHEALLASLREKWHGGT